jgi:hypothetical protein
LVCSRILPISPIGHINGCLQTLGDAELDLVPEINRVEAAFLTRTGLPGDPRLPFDAARGGCGRFINISEAACPASTLLNAKKCVAARHAAINDRETI